VLRDRIVGQIRACLALSGCLLTLSFAARAQERKPGLYELTITTTTVLPAASTYPARTFQACLTQEMIDQYGAIFPDRLTRVCQLANVVKKAGGMTADMVCTGPLTGKGTLAVSWNDAEHTTGNLHFSGTMFPGEKEIKVEWSAVTKSVFKSPDCGDILPPAQ
jgi:Protein of unknown function (DUF3617)